MALQPLRSLVLSLRGAAAILSSLLFILWKAWDQGEGWWAPSLPASWSGTSGTRGSQNLHFCWKAFVNEVDVLVLVVDCSDHLRLLWARRELHKLLDKDPDLPVVVVANKQDLNGAMSMVELQRELGLQPVDSQREVFLLVASIAPAGPGFGDPGCVHIWRLLLELLS